MSESKHTPGPWTVVRDKTLDQLSVIDGRIVIAAISPPHKANAHLIAAAPELLSELKNLLETIRVIGTQHAVHGRVLANLLTSGAKEAIALGIAHGYID